MEITLTPQKTYSSKWFYLTHPLNKKWENRQKTWIRYTSANTLNIPYLLRDI